MLLKWWGRIEAMLLLCCWNVGIIVSKIRVLRNKKFQAQAMGQD
jgi:hypothetical protein